MAEPFRRDVHPLPEGKQTRQALEHAGREATMRAELAEAVRLLFAGGFGREPRCLTPTEVDRLVSLTELVVRCRSTVERDGYTREIELIPEPEAPTRLAKVLERLLAGLHAIGLEREQAWRVATHVALDSIPAIRRDVMRALVEQSGEIETPKVAELLDYPTSTSRRALEAFGAVWYAVSPKGAGIRKKSGGGYGSY